jgi:hypothetical protein
LFDQSQFLRTGLLASAHASFWWPFAAADSLIARLEASRFWVFRVKPILCVDKRQKIKIPPKTSGDGASKRRRKSELRFEQESLGIQWGR